jgi:hypothetical protein
VLDDSSFTVEDQLEMYQKITDDRIDSLSFSFHHSRLEQWQNEKKKKMENGEATLSKA